MPNDHVQLLFDRGDTGAKRDGVVTDVRLAEQYSGALGSTVQAKWSKP